MREEIEGGKAVITSMSERQEGWDQVTSE